MSRRSQKAGFALMEVMIASAIFAIAAVGFSKAYITAIRTQVMAKNYYRATCIARNRIERARGTEFGSLPMLVEYARRINELGNADAEGKFVRFTFVNTNVAPDAASVTCSVYYPDRILGTSRKSIKVVTLIYKGM